MSAIVALDFGAGNIKRYAEAGSVVIPSQIATCTGEQLGEMSGIKRAASTTRIEIDGHRFYVGAGAHTNGRPVENLDDSRFVSGSPELRALTYAALDGSPADPMNAIIGLPQSALVGEQAAKTAAGLREWLVGEHRWQVNTVEHQATIEKVTVTSQAAGALFDWLLDPAGKFIADRRKKFSDEIGVLSVGMNTLELLVLHGGEIVNRFTGSRTAGVRRLLELSDPQGYYSRGELDTKLRAGRLDTRAALPIWGAEITGAIEQVWGTAHNRFSAVIMVGGGAVLLQNALMGMFNGRSYMPDDPLISVSRGLYKLALMKAK
jgi:hypothetical protein